MYGENTSADLTKMGTMFARQASSHKMKGRLRKTIFKFAGANAGVQALTLIATPFIARLYGPEEFGRAAVFFSLVVVLAVVGSLRYDQALAVPESTSERLTLLYVCVALVPTIILVELLVMELLAEHQGWFSSILRENELLSSGSVPAGIALISMNNALSAWLVRENYYGTVVAGRAVQSGVALTVQLIFGFSGYANAWALVTGMLVGYTCALIIFVVALRRSIETWFPKNSLRRMLSDVIKFKRFPLYNGWSSLLDTGTPQLPIFLLSQVHTDSVVGLYRMSLSLVQIPVSAVAAAATNVLMREVGMALQKGRQVVRERCVAILRVVALPAVGLLAIAPGIPAVLRLVLGPEWHGAGEYAQVLVLPAAFGLLAIPSAILPLIGQNRSEALWIVGRILLLGAVGFVCVNLALDPKTMVMAFSIVMVVAYAVLMLVWYRALWR